MPRIQRNVKKIEKARRTYRETPAKAKTREVIYQIIEEYDKLLTQQSANPNPETEKEIEKYQLYLKNKNQLFLYYDNYVKNNHIDGTIRSTGKVRELITAELAKESLIIADGLIRKPQTISLENTRATGNVFTILTKQEHIKELDKILSRELMDKPAKPFIPCNNMIMVIELGDYSPSMNHQIELIIKRVLLDFALKNGLNPKVTTDTLKYALL